jgi:hypothetical protein
MHVAKRFGGINRCVSPVHCDEPMHVTLCKNNRLSLPLSQEACALVNQGVIIRMAGVDCLRF